MGHDVEDHWSLEVLVCPLLLCAVSSVLLSIKLLEGIGPLSAQR